MFQGHGAAKGDQTRGGGKTETAGKLHNPQDPQGVFRKTVGSMAEDSSCQIDSATMGVENCSFPGIEADGVDGQVTSSCGLVEGQVGINFDLEILVTWTGPAFSSWQGELYSTKGENCETTTLFPSPQAHDDLSGLS